MHTATYLTNLIAGLSGVPAGNPDSETIEAVLLEAERFADGMLASGAAADRQGCRLEGGRVAVPAGQHQVWADYIKQGWNGLSTPEAFGGQELPLTVATAAQMLFDASDVALGMLALNQRCAIRLLLKVASPALQALWIPRLSSGEWGATICISEPEAGSDVGRIRTRAIPHADGSVRITGQKCWISYGDHDLTQGVVHFILARSPDLPPGSRGLSLFLLPDRQEDGSRNSVSVLRIEEKLGLHASPTCVLDFDNALAVPLSEPGRGLAALFEMIIAMRLGVAAQGSALAMRAADIAARYAFERRQGGPADAPAVPIHTHAEVRRSLLEMRLTADTMAGLTLQAAAWIDAGDQGDDAAAARAAVLLPVVKALAAEAAFTNANLAIQVLGGAGYTQEWPAERLLRDSRVFSIYEGTTAIQAMDFAFRRVFGRDQAAVKDVLSHFAPSPMLLDRLERVTARLAHASQQARERAALPMLRLFGLICADGMLQRYANGGGDLAARFQAHLSIHEATRNGIANWLEAQSELPDLTEAFTVLFESSSGVL